MNPWLIQVIFLPEIATPQATARLSAEGYSRNLSALKGLEQRTNELAGGSYFKVRIDERGPLTTVSPHGDSWWCGYDDVKHWIDPEASVILVSYEIDDDATGKSLNGYGGLGYFVNDIAFGSVPAWDGAQQYILDLWGLGPYLHEMLHGVCGYFVSKGVPMPELHNPQDYGYTFSSELEHQDTWYRDILRGQVTYVQGAALTTGSPPAQPGQKIGVTPAAWSLGSPRFYNGEVPVNQTFKDVPPEHKFYKDIEELAALNIVRGLSDGTFRPDASVTRGQMAAFLDRLRKLG